MGARQPENTRSFALCAHGGAGKTSLAEAMLFCNGQTTRMGVVQNGNTVSDFQSEEQKRQISISTSLLTLERKGKMLFALDAPGFADFTGEMSAAIRVADTAVILVSAVGGIEVQTSRAWEYAEHHNAPVTFYISKMDRENADFDKVLADIKDQFSPNALPVFLPIGSAEKLKGIVDVIKNKAYLYNLDGTGKFTEAEVPADMADAAAKAHEALVEAAVEMDDELMEKYLEGESISDQDFIRTLKKAIASKRIMPVLTGSATQNVGVHQMLDFITDYFPSPVDIGAIEAFDGDNKVEVLPDVNAPFSALCFKVMVDPYVGKLSFIRAYSGTLSSEGTNIYNVKKGDDERISSFKLMCGKDGKDVKEIIAGDIVAIPKLQSTKVGHTLATKGGAGYLFPHIEFPKPVYSVAVVAKTRADEDKMGNAISKTLEEDRSLTFEKNPETHDNVLSGMGDMHIDIVLSRMKERYGIELETKTPQVPYRETIRKTAEAQGKHKKQSGGHGQYGDVYIRYSPLERGAGFEFVDSIKGGAVPNNFIPAVEKGLREYMESGPLAGFPVVDFRAELYFGSYHEVDSSEMSFKLATRLSFKKGIMDASPVLLEPIMNVEVTVPDQFMGDVMGDFNSRRGRIMGMEAHGKLQVVKAQAPLAEMFRYAIILRSMTSGEGTFSMEYSHYEEVPADIAKKVIAAHKKEDEEEE
ncbi:MAG: elongation factor G [Synergistaceae bacterium]|nr:elongation factor G [Synergistaceae bacterium]MBQ9582345.1 elongation factor G [Synergistaceae bacterium]MBQ9895731.1 elongation factor G [Synergistaceae bacterium]